MRFYGVTEGAGNVANFERLLVKLAMQNALVPDGFEPANRTGFQHRFGSGYWSFANTRHWPYGYA